MPVVLTHQRKSRLSAMIDQPGGVSVGVALLQARANLDTLQARSQIIVLARIAELGGLVAPAPGDEAARRLLLAYELSSAVIDAAGPFELTDLCAVAAGLCDLIDAASPAEKAGDRPFDWRIVTVHAQSMQLILSLPHEAVEARAQVLGSLKQVLAKKIPAAQL
ncbi:hypothetical protein BH10PSE2_BH10PSE2_19030 [soil metagenome]